MGGSPRSLALPEAPLAVRGARREIRGVVGDALPPERLADALLLTTELVTNSLLHAPGPITLWSALTPERLRVEVHDHGPGPADPSPRPPSRGSGGGRGLYLVERLADRWGVRREPWTAVWFEIALPPRA
jgi:anti-sigma regulatory factor (Ser/Thr protein kinase)